MKIDLTERDALLLVDVQNDFLPGGSLAVAGADQLLPLLNRALALFAQRDLPIFATRDWHPENHCSFRKQGGPWPPHCVASTAGAAFPARLLLPPNATVISKGTQAGSDAYSGFEGTDLEEKLRARRVDRLFLAGLATDYCVLNTAVDALARDFHVALLVDAVRAVNVSRDDGDAAIAEMIGRGAQEVRLADLEAAGAIEWQPLPDQSRVWRSLSGSMRH